jgi:hypothetical protein
MIYLASTWVIPVLLAITLHEAAHGFVAHHFGDDTAWQLGRVSLNPLRHIDPFGTLVLPALLILSHAPFLFGYAKAVPVKFAQLRNPRRDMIWVAAAGPGMNLALAIAAALLLHAVPLLPAGIDQWFLRNLVNSININVVLTVFNLIPIPPPGWRPRRRRPSAQRPRPPPGPARALRHLDPDWGVVPSADHRCTDGRQPPHIRSDHRRPRRGHNQHDPAPDRDGLTG